MHWAIPFNKGTPVWMIFQSVPGGIDPLGYILSSLVNFSKFSVILRKLLSVLGESRQTFCPWVGK